MTPADAILTRAIEQLSHGDTLGAEATLLGGLVDMPTESRFYLVQGVAAREAGRLSDGVTGFWRALAADPNLAGARAALVDTVVTKETPTDLDFSLNSGERQVADTVAAIRADHRARYALAARWLRHHIDSPRLRVGLDVFCRNGYGSRMIADLAGARMMGLDGSAEAVAQATTKFGSHRVVYGHSVFPFTLAPNLFDFATCFESIEHVDDPAELLHQLSVATNGPFIVSVPLETGLPFAVNCDLFKHHVRHFTLSEMQNLLAKTGRVIAGEWGQVVYKKSRDRVNGFVPEHEMGVRPLDADSQFLIVVACMRMPPFESAKP
jgi:2-polyprenyl-3-methyl-5-hydroxy-6-metoxy-1,4-benzoquinol methylase